MDQVDPRDLFYLQKKKLELNDSMLQLDHSNIPDRNYCKSWLKEFKNDSRVKGMIDNLLAEMDRPEPNN